VLSRLVVSIRISLLIAFGATLLGMLVGATLGLLAAHLQGVAEQAVLLLVDVQAALPFIILALAVLAFFGNALPLLIGLLGLYGWERHARVARGLALAAGTQGYVLAVRQIGAGPWRLYLRHVLPNIAATLIVSATLAFPEVILLESGLSFLGLGVLAKGPAAVVLAGGGAAVATAVQSHGRPSSAVQQDTVRGSNAATHVSAVVAYSPTGWGTAMQVRVAGVPTGTTCRFWVVTSAGQRLLAGTWTSTGSYAGTWYPATSQLAPGSVRSFQLTAHGQALLTIPAS